jgi:hypothetical protein
MYQLKNLDNFNSPFHIVVAARTIGKYQSQVRASVLTFGECQPCYFGELLILTFRLNNCKFKNVYGVRQPASQSAA